MIDLLVELFSPAELRKLVYVADSALITDENLNKLAKIKVRFLSRLPENYKVAAKAKILAWKGDWTPMGKVSSGKKAASYWASEQTGIIADREYRLVVFRSSHLAERKTKTLEKELLKEEERLEKETTVLANQSFSCQEDAETVSRDWLKKNQGVFHELSTTGTATQEIKKRSTRGVIAENNFYQRAIRTFE